MSIPPIPLPSLPSFLPSRIIQVDLVAEEFHQNIKTDVGLLGDIGETLALVRKREKIVERWNNSLDYVVNVSVQMTRECGDWAWNKSNEWTKNLNENRDKNVRTVEDMANQSEAPLNYFAAYQPVCIFEIILCLFHLTMK